MNRSVLEPIAPFTRNSLLIVEGADEVELFTYLAAQRGIPCPSLWDLKGRGNLGRALLAIKTHSGIEKIETVGLVLDSEDDLNETRNLAQRFTDFSFLPASQPQTLFLQLPNVNTRGSLERICLSSIPSDDKLLACSQQFIACVSGLEKGTHALTTQALRDSAQLLAWYTAKSGKPISRIGISTKSDLRLDAHHEAFNDIASFIAKVANHVQ